MDFTTG